MKGDELISLIENWVNEEITDDELRVLQEQLRSDPSARRLLVRYTNLDSALRDLGAMEPEVSAWQESREAVASDKVVAGPWNWRSTLAAAAMAVALIGVTSIVFREAGRIVDTGEATAEGYAVLTQLVDAEWAEGAEQVQTGDPIASGRIRLASGLAQIEFYCGATVILEGESDFEIRSAWEAYCHQGTLRAEVPPAARGFTIHTADMEVVDLGTEFGLSVGNQGKSQVHVFDGKVKLNSGGVEFRELNGGDGLEVDGEGGRRDIEADPVGFPSAGDLEERSEAERRTQFERWREHSEQLRVDPRLIAYYPMDQEGTWNRRVHNEAGGSDREMSGAMVGVQRVAGRFGSGKSAIEFRNPGDRVRTFIPGEYGALTLACWVKLDSLDRLWNSLFLTDGYEHGEVHWQITEERKLTFSLRVSGEKKGNYLYQSPPFWDDSMRGKWMHLATVYDLDRREVVHFVNGEELSREKVSDERFVPVTRFGASEIGNWGLSIHRDDPEFVIRSLDGLMDEFAIFSAALSPDEIREQFEKGRP